MMVLVALIEYAYRSLPHQGWQAAEPVRGASSANANEATSPLGNTPTLKVRQVLGTEAASAPSSGQDADDTSGDPTDPIFVPTGPESVASSGSYLDEYVTTVHSSISSSTPILLTVPSAYIDPAVVTSQAIVNSAEASAYLGKDVTTVLPTPAPVPSAYIDPAVGTSQATSTTDAGAYLSKDVTTVPPPVALTAALSAYIDPTVTTKPAPVIATQPSAYIDPTVTTKSAPVVTIQSVSVVTSQPSTTTSSSYIDPTVASKHTLVVTIQTFSIVTPQPSTIAPNASIVTSGSDFPVTSSPPLSTTPGTSISRTLMNTAQDASQPSGTVAWNHTYQPLVDLTGPRYFVGAYLAVFLAILLRTLIGWLYATTKMLEPFFYLARPEGALAKDFFHTNYLSTNDIWTPFKSLLGGHWVMLWTSGLYTVTVVITPFATELLHFAEYCYYNDENALICGPEMRINPTVARIIQALLAITLGFLFIAWVLLRRQRSGVYSDPSSIATLASLLHNPEVVADFRNISPGASKEEMLQAVAGRRYQLGTYRCIDGTERYGLVVGRGQHSDSEDSRHGNPYEPVANPGGAAEASDATGNAGRKKRHTVLHLIRDMAFGLVTAGILVLIIYYFRTGYNTGFERFMDSQSFGPRFVMAVVGMIIQSQWRRLERGMSIHSSIHGFLQATRFYITYI